MWFVLQSLIIFAVIASNIHWHWTPNGYLPAILGAGLAWLLTRPLSVRWRERQTLDSRIRNGYPATSAASNAQSPLQVLRWPRKCLDDP